ncbi:uncharacterized protein LOC135486308 [Lineus longissimus]|uniref:uncharacterized protein LOC135486308 n=1 Tax=Lineus longissimus TaxID=88925 RepID=UPI002B4C8EB5
MATTTMGYQILVYALNILAVTSLDSNLPQTWQVVNISGKCVRPSVIILPLTTISVDEEPILTCPINICNASCQPVTASSFVGCHCDSDCEIFKDCCHGHETCNATRSTSFDTQYLPYMVCMNIFHKYTISVVSKCPQSASHSVKMFCDQNPYSNFPNIILSGDDRQYFQLPVTNNGTLFRNIFCASCHGVSLNDVEFLKASVFCENTLDDTVDFKKASVYLDYTIGHKSFLSKCEVGDILFNDKRTFVRSCEGEQQFYKGFVGLGEIVSSCNQGLRHFIIDFDILEKKCGRINAFIDRYSIYGNTRYRNIYCARCNGVSDNDTSLACSMRHEHKSNLDNWGGSTNDLHGFSTLMDLTQTKTKKCINHQHVFDLFSKSCRPPVKCGIGFVFWNGTCIRDPLDEAYELPMTKQGRCVSVRLEIKSPILIVSNKSYSQMKEAIKYQLLSWVTSLFNISESFVLNFEVNVNLVNNLYTNILDGNIYQVMSHDIYIITFCVKISPSDDILRVMQDIHSHMWFVKNTSNVHAYGKIMISNQNALPPTCRTGKLVQIVFNSTYQEFLNETGRLNDLPSMFLIFDNKFYKASFRVEGSQSVNIYLCDLYGDRFRNCSNVFEHSLDDFHVTESALKHKLFGEEIKKSEVAIIGTRVLTCSRVQNTTSTDSQNMEFYISVGGICLSIVFLVYTLLTYCLLPQLRTLPGVLLMQLAANLSLAQLVFMVGINMDISWLPCKIIAIAGHYLWLVAFCWKSIIAFHTAKTFGYNMMANASNSNSKRSLKYYSSFAYGAPCLVVIPCIVIFFCGCTDIEIGYGPYAGTSGACWIREQYTLIYAFMVPLGALLAANLTLFTFTVITICRQKAMTSMTRKNDVKRMDVVLYIKLSFLMGFAWIFGFISGFTGDSVTAYLFTVLNTLQGVFIGLCFGLNRRVIRMYRKRLGFEVSQETGASGTLTTGVHG